MKKFTSLFLTLVLICTMVSGCSKKQTQKNPENITPDLAQTQCESVIPIQTEFTISNEKVSLEKVSLFDGKLEILIPRGFTLMSEELKKVKYPTTNSPDIIYTNNKADVNITFKLTETPLTDSQITQMVSNFKSNFEKSGLVIAWGGYETLTINGKQVGVLQPLTKAADTNIYNIIFFFELDGKLLLIGFNCTEKQAKDWEPVGKSIMNSLKVVK